MIALTSQNSQVVATLTVRLNGALFNSFRNAVRAAGGRYIGDNKNVLPVNKVAVFLATARESGLDVTASTDVAELMLEKAAESAALVADAEKRADHAASVLDARGASLFGFQRAGVRWLADRSSALLADEMGTGKTLQTLVALPANAPIVVVCPAVAKAVWRREAAAWRKDLDVIVLSGRGSFVWPKPGQMVVVNYDILPAELPDGCPVGLCLVADEAHALKSLKAQRTVRFRALAKLAAKKYGLTATPLLNRPNELWTLLQTFDLAKQAFGSWFNFVSIFGGVESRFGLEWTRPVNQDAAKAGLERVMLRRMKRDVLADLPEKTYTTHSVDIGASLRKQADKIAQSLEKQGFSFDSEASDAEIDAFLSSCPGFEELSKLRAKLADAKIGTCLELVEQYEEQGAPVVVASAHRAPIDVLGAREGWATITGDTSPEERGQIQDAFQAGKLRGVALTIQAGGVAITLTNASHMIFVDHSWTPALDMQCEDRIHRIGQKNACSYISLVADHAIDRMIEAANARKRTMIARSVDAASRTADAEITISSDEIEAVLSSLVIVDAQEQAERVEQAQKTTSRFIVDGRGKKVRTRNESIARHAKTDAERAAVTGLQVLAALDTDRASERNGVGFSQSTSAAGHALAALLGAGLPVLESDWALAVKICQVHKKQLV